MKEQLQDDNNDNELTKLTLKYLKAVYGEEVHMLAETFYTKGNTVVFDEVNRKAYPIASDIDLWNYVSLRYNMQKPMQLFIRN